MSKRIIRKHDGKRVPMTRFKQVRAVVSEHFDEFILIVKSSERDGAKSNTMLEWGCSDPYWAQGAILKVDGHLE